MEEVKPAQKPEDFAKEVFPSQPGTDGSLTPSGQLSHRPMAHTGYPHHEFTPDGKYRGFKKGHPKLGGKKKGFKHFKTRFMEELEGQAVNERGVTVRNDVAIVKKAIEMARQGDIRAIEFIIERVDGKVPNIIAGSEENPLQIVVESVISDKYSQK